MATTSKHYYITDMNDKIIDPRSYRTETDAMEGVRKIFREPGYFTPREVIIWIEKIEESEDGYRKVTTNAATHKAEREADNIINWKPINNHIQ